MKKKLETLSNNRDDTIDKFIKQLRRVIAKYQSDMYDDVIEKIIDDLTIDDAGKIKFNNKNINLSVTVRREIEKFQVKQSAPLIRTLVKYAAEIAALDSEIIKLTADKFTNKIQKEATKKLFKSLGYDTSKRKIIKDGYLYSLTRNSSLVTDIGERLVTAVTSKIGVRDFRKQFKNTFLGQGKDQLGFVEKRFNLFTRNFFSQVSANIQNELADELELQWFIYSSPRTKDSRPFCLKRKGIMYSREFVESEGWENETWKGKISGGISFYIQRGGHNCIDNLSFISTELAELLIEQGQRYNVYN